MNRMLTLRSGFLIEIGRATLRVHDLRHTDAALAQVADILALARPRLWRWKALYTDGDPVSRMTSEPTGADNSL